MSKKTYTPSVLFFKRMIAGTLATVILLLAVLNVVSGIRLRRSLKQLELYKAVEAERFDEAETARKRDAGLFEKLKPSGEADAAEILGQSRIIAHAMGSVDGVRLLNCLDGFKQNYDAGVRVFEADFRQTADGYVVLRHDWRGGWQEGVDEVHVPTLEEFLALPVLDKYTPLSFSQLLQLMVDYPDVCIITDTKFMDPESVMTQFNQMLLEARTLGLSYLFDRMYIQVYSQLHFQIVDAIHHFPHYIYTLYQDNFEQTEQAFRERAIFAQEHGIEAITMWDFQWSEDWRAIADYRKLKILVHTVDDRDTARALLKKGVSAVYTDTLRPADLEG